MTKLIFITLYECNETILYGEKNLFNNIKKVVDYYLLHATQNMDKFVNVFQGIECKFGSVKVTRFNLHWIQDCKIFSSAICAELRFVLSQLHLREMAVHWCNTIGNLVSKASLADLMLWGALSRGSCLGKPCLYRRRGKLEKYEIVPGCVLYVRLCIKAYACL